MTLSRRGVLLVAPLVRLTADVKPVPAPSQNITILAMDHELRLSITYFDQYVSGDFRFKELTGKSSFCLGRDGVQDQNCLAGFVGSLAVVNFRVTPRRNADSNRVLIREHVRMIDRHDRLPERPPYDRIVELRDGLGTDIQAFGYEATSLADATAAKEDDTWCLFRQDLYLGESAQRFTTLHWKHTLANIRLLDLIPSGDARLVA
jgi:hypothetical protein